MNVIQKLFCRTPDETLTQAVNLLPDPALLSRLGEARSEFRVGHYQLALELCQHVILLDPHHADAYRIRGLIRYKLHDRAGASKDFAYSLTLP